MIFHDYSRFFKIFHDYSRFFMIFHDYSRFFSIIHNYSQFFLKKSAIWWRKSELKRHLVAKTCIFLDFSRLFTIFHDFSRFFTIIHDFSRFFLKKSALWWGKNELKRHLVAKTCIFQDFSWFFTIIHDISWFFTIIHDFSRFFHDFSRSFMIFYDFFLKKRHLVAEKWTKAPSGGQNLHFSWFFTIIHDLSWFFTIIHNFSRSFMIFHDFFLKKAPSGGEKVN